MDEMQAAKARAAYRGDPQPEGNAQGAEWIALRKSTYQHSILLTKKAEIRHFSRPLDKIRWSAGERGNRG